MCIIGLVFREMVHPIGSIIFIQSHTSMQSQVGLKQVLEINHHKRSNTHIKKNRLKYNLSIFKGSKLTKVLWLSLDSQMLPFQSTISHNTYLFFFLKKKINLNYKFLHTLFLIIDTNYQSHHASFFKLTEKISYVTLPKHTNTYIQSCIKTKNYSRSYMLMHIYSNSTLKTKQKF